MAVECPCQQEDAGQAREFLLDHREHLTLVDESHFDVSLIRCTQCRQLYLRTFYELIDWTNGEDSQADWYFPIEDAMGERIRGIGPAMDEREIDALGLDGRFLFHAWPSGREPYCQWMHGQPMHFPHD